MATEYIYLAYTYRDGYKTKRIRNDGTGKMLSIIQRVCNTIEKVRELFCDEIIYNVISEDNVIPSKRITMIKQGFNFKDTKSGLLLITRGEKDEPEYFKDLGNVWKTGTPAICVFDVDTRKWTLYTESNIPASWRGILHVRPNQTCTCICKDSDEFDRDLRMIYGTKVITDYSMDGLSVGVTNARGEDEYIIDEQLCKDLSKFYNVRVTSVHIDDNEYPIGVWIVYK